MVKKKSGSKRQTLKQKYKIQKRVKEHDRKLKKLSKKGGKAPGKKFKDPGIPNSWPLKKELLEQVSLAKERAAAKKVADREARLEAKRAAKAGGASSSRRSRRAAGGAPASQPGGGGGASMSRDAQMDVGDAAQRSARAYAGLAKVVESSDVLLEVLDARDPGVAELARRDARRGPPGKRLVLGAEQGRPRAPGRRDALARRPPGTATPSSRSRRARRRAARRREPLDKARDAAARDRQKLTSVLGVDPPAAPQELRARRAAAAAAAPARRRRGVGFPNAGKSSVIKSSKAPRRARSPRRGTGVRDAGPQDVEGDQARPKLTLIDPPASSPLAQALRAGADDDKQADALAPPRPRLRRPGRAPPPPARFSSARTPRPRCATSPSSTTRLSRPASPATGKLKRGGVLD